MKPTKAELVETARRIRAMSPYSDVDSTDLIREDREGRRNDEASAAADAIREKDRQGQWRLHRPYSRGSRQR